MYSWKLEKSDKLPIGKKDYVALRVQIEDWVCKSTQVGYKTVINVLMIDEFDSHKISDIHVSNAKL